MARGWCGLGLDNLGSDKRIPPWRWLWALVVGATFGAFARGLARRGRALACLPTLNAGGRAGIRLPPRTGRRRSLGGPTAARSAWRETAHAAGRRSQTGSAPLRAGERRAGAPASRAAGSR